MPRIESKPKTTIFEGKVVTTIDCTPTFVAAARIYMLVLENGNEEGKKAAREGLLEMAAYVDQVKAEAAKTVSIDWTISDLHAHNEENENYPMTDEDAREILEAAIADHDPEFGITWTHIDNEIEEWKARQDAIENRAKQEAYFDQKRG